MNGRRKSSGRLWNCSSDIPGSEYKQKTEEDTSMPNIFGIDVFGTGGGVEISMNSPKVEAYIEKHELQDVISDIADAFSEAYEDWRILEAELEKSFALSLCAILQKHRDDCVNGDIDSTIDVDELDRFIKYIRKNKDSIDSEVEGKINLIASVPEDGFAYVQRLEYRQGKGKLIKWPCEDGWNWNDGGGYQKIQEFNMRLNCGEIEELSDLGSLVFEIVDDEQALEEAISRTGIVHEFIIKAAKKKTVDSDSAKEKESGDAIHFDGNIFVLTGLDDEAEEVSAIIEENGGEIKSSTVLKTNYLIYDPVSGIGTTKYKKALELIEKGKPIQMMTVEEFLARVPAKSAKATDEKNAGAEQAIAPSNMVFDDQGNFYRTKKSVQELIIPGTVNGKPVQIGDNAFCENKTLERVVFLDGVQAIGNDAFYGCKNLKEIIFAPSIRRIGSGFASRTPWMKAQMQQDCIIVNNILLRWFKQEQHVVIPDGVTVIAPDAFYCQSTIYSVVIPDTVNEIGNYAFSNCHNLADIKLPDHEIELGLNPFSGTAWESEQSGYIVIGGILKGFSMKYFYEELCDVETLVIPEGVTRIEDHAFRAEIYDWSNVKKIILPEGLVSIGRDVFKGFAELEEVIFPSTIDEIGPFAFADCEKLTRKDLPASATKIDPHAFLVFPKFDF